MIGIDISKISRYEKIKSEEYSHWEKYFSEKEWKFCFLKSYPAQHLAGIFSCKEAVMKAQEGLMGHYKDIEVLHEESGKPVVVVGNEEKSKFHVSISHDSGMAVAVAINLS